MRKYLVFGDAHLEAGVAPDHAYELVKKVAKAVRFDGIYILGDLMDYGYISRFTEDTPGLTEGKRLKADFALMEKELSYFRKLSKETVFLAGNHEDRVLKYLQKYPVLEGTFDIADICKDAGVGYVPTNLQPYKAMQGLYLTHGLNISKYVAAKTTTDLGASVVSGHCHRTQSYSYRYPTGQVTTGYTVGTVGPLNPDYVAGVRITGWTQSFGILYVDDGWQFDTIMIDGGKCIVGGKKHVL